MQIPKGLYLRGGTWRIDNVVRAGKTKKHIRQTTGRKEEEFEEAKHCLEGKIADALIEIKAGPKRVEHTFQDAAIEYVVSLEQRGKDIEGTRFILKRVMDEIGNLPLSHVHQGSLNPWIQAQYGKRKSSTVKRTIGVVVAVLNHAARVLRDGNRPWLEFAVPKIQPPDWKDAIQPYRLTWDEQDNLINRLPPHIRAAALFAVSTGAREQEIAFLRWDQECEVTGLAKGAVWWIPPGIRKGNAKRSTSEQEGRYLICNTMARSVIDANRRTDSDWAFPGPKGTRVQRWNNTAWRNARADVGIPARFHDLRHTFGERAAAAGVPWDFRKVLLGHEIRDITGHYSAPGLKLRD